MLLDNLEEENNISNYSKNNDRRPPKKNEPINDNIRAKEVLVIGSDGTRLGVMKKADALKLAQSQELDLYCVAPNAKPPVCKICNYGKLKFEKQKAAKEAKKNQKTSELKQIQITPQIGQHDMDTKARKAKKFLEDGNRVEVCIVYRGRQLAHKEVGYETLNRFCSQLEDIGQIDKAPYWEGKWYKCIMGPIKNKKQ